MQQRVAARLRSDAAFDTAVLIHLIRRPMWLAGLALVIVSLSLQATALGLGRLVIIEPVLASSLLFALALAAWADHRRMRPVEWLAALATFAGLAVFLSVAQPSGGQSTAKPGQLGLAAIAAVVIAVGAGVLSTRLSPLRRALTLGIGGGIAAGVTDALTKTVAALAGAHQLGDLRRRQALSPDRHRPADLHACSRTATGPPGLAAFLPVFSVLDPAVGSFLGLVLYHEHLGGGPVRIGIEVAAVLAATWGITRLARSTAEAEPIEPVLPPALGTVGATPIETTVMTPLASAPASAQPAPVPVPVAGPLLPPAAPVPLAVAAAEESSAPH